MRKEYVPLLPDADPYRILGISENSGQEEVRRAYLEKIRQYPPDHSPEEFERIRDAYAVLSNPLQRSRTELFSVNPEQSLVDLLDNLEARRDVTGPEPWLAAMER
jgi:curved DNA-binding protein CbpA